MIPSAERTMLLEQALKTDEHEIDLELAGKKFDPPRARPKLFPKMVPFRVGDRGRVLVIFRETAHVE